MYTFTCFTLLVMTKTMFTKSYNFARVAPSLNDMLANNKRIKVYLSPLQIFNPNIYLGQVEVKWRPPDQPSTRPLLKDYFMCLHNNIARKYKRYILFLSKYYGTLLVSVCIWPALLGFIRRRNYVFWFWIWQFKWQECDG